MLKHPNIVRFDECFEDSDNVYMVLELTICGTPNYIAPEVLFDTANGHSFEVDVWSVGVILYTLLIGKPPFQTKEVKAIYRRIRENRYEFPEDKEISASAQNLIMSILNRDPLERPTLDEILEHSWFHDGPFPSHVPVSANDGPPDFFNLNAAQSRRNFDNVHRRAAGQTETATPPQPPRVEALGTSILAQQRDFKAAVEPGSPISALLNSARQPLVQAPAGTKNSALLRKLNEAGAASTLSPGRRGTGQRVPASVSGPAPSSRPPAMDNVAEDAEEEEDEGVDPGPETPERPGSGRELAQQKARIVSEMAQMRITDSDRGSDKEPPRKVLSEASVQPSSSLPVIRVATSGDGYDRAEHNLAEALAAYKSHGGCRVPDGTNLEAPKVFVVSWLDYCAKYGMGFAMCDGTVSVHFNDSSSLALAPSKKHIEYVDERRRSAFALASAPDSLANKLYLLRKFEGYMLSRLCGNYEYTWEDVGRTRDLVYVEKYLRTKNVILFRLSNGILQFNFYDHTKVILAADGLFVTIIDKHYAMHRWPLADMLRPQGATERERAKHERFISKLEYARSVLTRMRAHGGMDDDGERKSKDKGREREKARERDARPIRG
ncbi:unnamed protein product [Cutaneotrichosporon oleaginosum]